MSLAKQETQATCGKTPVTASRRSSRLSKHRLFRLGGETGRYALLLFFAVIFLMPFIWIAFWALKTEPEIGANPFSPPIPPRWENLPRVWNQGNYSKYLPNTLIYAFGIAIGVCFFSCLAGYSLARIRFPGRQLLFNFFLIGLMVPFFALMVPLYFLARDFHILGTRWALIVPGIALALPFGIFLMRSFFLSLPEELADAARIDGCNELNGASSGG